MPRVCTVCKHEARETIDRALVAGEALRGLSALYRVSEDALARHKDKHIPAAMVQAHGAADVAHADNLLDELQRLTTEARRIKDKAEKAEDYRAAIAGIRELVRIVELLAKLQGQIDDRPQVNVMVNSSEWISLRSAILAALDPYPPAREAVIRAITGG